tara:strand:- start:416 stop:1528 length:1113 start_codon:yes stop_codon:yes gene_type:complete
MSIFDRQKPLKSFKRYFERFFHKKETERIDFVDTTKPVSVEFGEAEAAGFTDDFGGPDNPSVPDSDELTLITDTDADTKVQCEESDDEDKIRFDTGGNERMRIEANDTNGVAIYLKEGSGTTAPGTPSSGEGVLYLKNDGNLYLKDDAGAEVDLTSGGGGGGSMSNFVLEDGNGDEVTIENAKEIKFVEGTGIDIDWTDTSDGTDADPYDLTFTVDLEGTELKSTGESGGSKFLREDGDGSCSWQTISTTSRSIISHTWAIAETVEASTLLPMTVRNTYSGAGYTTTVKLVSVIYSISGGTNATWRLLRNGSDISGYGTSGSPLTATTTPATTEGTITLSDKDELAPIISGVSGSPENLSITVFLEITAA